jgi:transposase
MKLYCGIDLHSNNNYMVVQDEQDQLLYRKRLPNELGPIVAGLKPFQQELVGVVVESTYNWYWLVDGLMERGHRVHLANTAAIEQYSGLKYSDDFSDAEWLARMLRLGVLPEGYIYPQPQRPLRDLLRHRLWLVRDRTRHLLHVGNILTRHTGGRFSRRGIEKLTATDLEQLFSDQERPLAVGTSLAVLSLLTEKIGAIEKQVKSRVQLDRSFHLLETVYGIGEILAMTIWLETGDIGRFPQVGNYASYCRCVGSRRMSNDKKKGENNHRNGNQYLAWAYVEAAHQAARHYPQPHRYVEKKTAQRNHALALKALAHKLARACYYVLRDQVPFEPERLFGS